MVWNWLEWTNAGLSIPLALGGFGFAYWQIHKTKKAAIAARDAANNASQSYRSLATASVLPQLVNLESALDVAVDNKSTVLLRHVIQTWKWQAGACRHFLELSEQEHDQAMKVIQRSISAATALKQDAAKFSGTTDWSDATERLRKAIGDVTAELGAISAKQSLDTTNGGGNG
ncbi:hypothetical protein [Tsukamurella sp. NPDC003166]|uniref:hypothetical protein n=1 Tax=Tsukamurella sp. NPDC003166 TaxID=3154444 RepID=UPI00339DF8C0